MWVLLLNQVFVNIQSYVVTKSRVAFPKSSVILYPYPTWTFKKPPLTFPTWPFRSPLIKLFSRIVPLNQFIYVLLTFLLKWILSILYKECTHLRNVDTNMTWHRAERHDTRQSDMKILENVEHDVVGIWQLIYIYMYIYLSIFYLFIGMLYIYWKL